LPSAWVHPRLLVEFVLPDLLCVCLVDCCLSFCTFSFGHCVVCSSSIYGFWLPLGIFKPFSILCSNNFKIFDFLNLLSYGVPDVGYSTCYMLQLRHLRFYYWIDTSIFGLLVPKGIILLDVNSSTLPLLLDISVIWILQFVNNVITKTKVLLPQTQVTMQDAVIWYFRYKSKSFACKLYTHK
jgi:hypothetical protein